MCILNYKMHYYSLAAGVLVWYRLSLSLLVLWAKVYKKFRPFVGKRRNKKFNSCFMGKEFHTSRKDETLIGKLNFFKNKIHFLSIGNSNHVMANTKVEII